MPRIARCDPRCDLRCNARCNTRCDARCNTQCSAWWPPPSEHCNEVLVPSGNEAAVRIDLQVKILVAEEFALREITHEIRARSRTR